MNKIVSFKKIATKFKIKNLNKAFVKQNIQNKHNIILSEKHSLNKEKQHRWLKYYQSQKYSTLLFSIDQFLFEFLKRSTQKRNFSEFKIQLKETKKLKIFYGLTSTKQLLKIANKALKYPGYFSMNFLALLERRLDIILYRSNFTKSIIHARQLISHKKIKVNNKIISIPSYQVQIGDIISVDSKTQNELVSSIKNEHFTISNKIDGSNTLFPEKFLENIYKTKPLSSNKYLYFLTKLLLKKIFNYVDIEIIKNPYSINLLGVLYKKLQKNSFFGSKKVLFEKYYYRQILFNVLTILQIKNLPRELLVLKLSKILKKVPLNQKYLNSLQIYRPKPLHLEVSYKLMKIIVLYSPQRIYYPFFINVDIFKKLAS